MLLLVQSLAIIMGTRELFGIIRKGVYRGTFNPDNSDPPTLGNAIIRFILSHMHQESGETIIKLERVREHQTLALKPYFELS